MSFRVIALPVFAVPAASAVSEHFVPSNTNVKLIKRCGPFKGTGRGRRFLESFRDQPWQYTTQLKNTALHRSTREFNETCFPVPNSRRPFRPPEPNTPNRNQKHTRCPQEATCNQTKRPALLPSQLPRPRSPTIGPIRKMTEQGKPTTPRRPKPPVLISRKCFRRSRPNPQWSTNFRFQDPNSPQKTGTIRPRVQLASIFSGCIGQGV